MYGTWTQMPNGHWRCIGNEGEHLPGYNCHGHPGRRTPIKPHGTVIYSDKRNIGHGNLLTGSDGLGVKDLYSTGVNGFGAPATMAGNTVSTRPPSAQRIIIEGAEVNQGPKDPPTGGTTTLDFDDLNEEGTVTPKVSLGALALVVVGIWILFRA